MQKILLILFIAFPLNVFAAKQYRCNGVVQYRPCNQSATKNIRASTNQNLNYNSNTYRSGSKALANSRQNSMKAAFKFQTQMKGESGPLYADIVQANYQKYEKRNEYGQWRGVVKGNGDIHLNLLISQKGKPEENRYMGHVKLKEDQTSFNFISSPPKAGTWTWKILAIPK